jgi:hypothetical protein
MKFHQDANPLCDEALDHACGLIDADPPTFWAVVGAASGGFGFLPSRRPVIRFERQLFHDLTGGRFDATDPGVSDPEPGGHLGGAHEYARLERAAQLDQSAALQSTLWGLGQVPGFHFASLGYRSIEQMVEAMVHGEDDQALALARLISDEGIDLSLIDRNWEGAVEGFRGAGCVLSDHVAKLATAYDRYRTAVPNLDIRGAQAALLFLGFDPGPIDGRIGPRSRSALMAFQRKRRDEATGRLDQQTIDYLVTVAFDLPR